VDPSAGPCSSMPPSFCGAKVSCAPSKESLLRRTSAPPSREAAREMATIAQEWTRDLLVVQAGGAALLEELRELAGRVAAGSAPVRLLEQAAACADALEALEQNGNGRLQLERLFLRLRESRHA